MTIKISGIAASTKLSLDGQRFTKEALEQMAKQAPGLTLTNEFDHHKREGKVTSSAVAEREGDHYLHVEAEVGEMPADDRLYIVPSFAVFECSFSPSPDWKGHVMTVTGAATYCFGLVRFPLDPALRPVRVDPESLREAANGFLHQAKQILVDIAEGYDDLAQDDFDEGLNEAGELVERAKHLQSYIRDDEDAGQHND